MINRGLLIILAIAASLGLWFAISVIKSDKSIEGKKSVMILQIVEHPALDATRMGIEKYLYDCCNITTLHESAQGDPALASQIAQKFAQQKPAAVVTIGTIATQSAMQKITSIPIVFSSVTDPLGSGIVKNLNAPEANVTGVSNYVSTKTQLEIFIKFLPNLKNIGFIYNPGESNSIRLLADTKEAATGMGLNIVEVVANSSSEVSTAATSLIGKVDAIFINNDSTALSAIQSIVRVAEHNNIPVLCSDIDTVNNGVMLSVGPNQFDIGVATGEIVEQIIEKGVKISKIPVTYPKELITRVNLKAATQINITLPTDLLKSESVEVVG